MAAEPTELKRKAPSVAVDLDANRAIREAARREAEQEAPVVVFGGERYTLPVECPFTLVEDLEAIGVAEAEKDGAAAAAATVRMIRSLLTDQYDEFMKNEPSMNDLQAMVEGVLPAYGLMEETRGN